MNFEFWKNKEQYEQILTLRLRVPASQRREEVTHVWDLIFALRHQVYANKLQKYDSNSDQKLEDPGRHFIAKNSTTFFNKYTFSIINYCFFIK